ncbi:MAG: molecular chaperone DnaK, partial [Alphaproteobacteria bacterium]|nr:molecular chaperone DnaK [Alphaproteobacteria bacterium]
TFDIDANGIVSVSAKDKATNKEQQIRIQPSGGLSKDDIEKMVKDAEKHSAEDKKRREKVEARNHADALIHSAEKNLKEFGDKVGEADKSAIETAIKDLKAVLDGDDADAIKAKTDALAQATMKLGEAMYKASQAEAAAKAQSAQATESAGAQAGTQAGGGADAKAGESKVVDADFEEVDPDKPKKKN